jgi:uncharacterized protein (DUF305 family)
MNTVIRTCLAISLLAVAVTLAGCGGDDDGDAQETTSASGVPFDRAFIDAVVPHHQSAIAMAKAAKEEGLSQPALIEIADDIIVTQQPEIDRMLEWREKWYGSREIDPEGAEALGLSEAEMGMEHTTEDIRASVDIDQAFAEMMMAHHEGAITMAELALERAQHEEIKSLAEDIIEAQSRENEVLEEHAGMAH